MDSIYAIGLGLGLRVVVDAVSQHNLKIGGTLVGLWEGVVLYHFLGKMPRSSDPYVAYGFRLLVDFLFTESLAKMGIVMLWTGLGVLLSDVGPVLWKDSGMRRLHRRYWVRMPRLPTVPKVAIPTRRTVQFWESPPTPSSAASDITESPTTVLPIPPPRTRVIPRDITPPLSPRPPYPFPRNSRSRPPPGSLPGIWSETETEASATQHTNTTSNSNSNSATATPIMTYMPEIISDEDEQENAAGVVSTLLDADGVPTPSSELTPTRNSYALPTTEEFQVVEREEAQPDFDQLGNIPDAEGSSTSLPLPIPVPQVIPPQPVPTVPVFNVVAPVVDELPTIPENEAAILAGPSDGTVLPPPKYESDRLSVSDVPDRKSFASELTVPETVLHGSRDSLITHADLLREKAEEEEKIRAHLVSERRRLEKAGDVKGAFLLRADIETAEARAKKFHEQAERRYYTGYNKDSTPMTIDVHKLKQEEAVRRTEKAIRDLLLNEGTELRVITAGKIVKGTHLKIIGAMQEHRIHAIEDPFQPGVVIITLPQK